MGINNRCLWEKYIAEKFCSIPLGLRFENTEKATRYFCTPQGAKIFASMGMGGIHYCTIPDFGEMIFVVTPEPCSEHYVFPIANNIKEFLQLVVAMCGTQLIDQIPLFDKGRFEHILQEHISANGSERMYDLNALTKKFSLSPLEKPVYDYVMDLYRDFDYSKIVFTSDYYDILGLEYE